MLFVEPDQHLAKLGFKDVGEKQDRRLQHDPGKLVGRRQGGDDVEEPGGTAVLERHHRADPKRRVKEDEEAAEWQVALTRLGIGRDGAVEPRDRQVEVKEITDAGDGVGNPPFGLVARVDRDAKKAGSAVVEQMPVCEDVVDRRAADRIADGAVEAEDNVPAWRSRP